MEGSFYTGAQTQEGSWSFRYDRWGQPIYVAKNLISGVPDQKAYAVYLGKDKELFKEIFEVADPNNPGGFLKTTFEFTIYHPPGTPDEGKVQVKIFLILDLQNVPPGGQGKIFVGSQTYTYRSDRETKKRLVLYEAVMAPGVPPAPKAFSYVYEYWMTHPDGKMDQLIKAVKDGSGKYLRIDDITFKWTQSGLYGGVTHYWSDCTLDPTHCGWDGNTNRDKLFGKQAKISTTRIVYDDKHGLKEWTNQENYGHSPGATIDLNIDKVIACTVTHKTFNDIPIYGLPQILKDFGFTETGLPLSLYCETTFGGNEVYNATFTWAHKWRFMPF